MAEEIALHLILDAAAGVVADKSSELELFTGGMLESLFDFDFDLLHSVLYQDKDYEYAYLHSSQLAKPGGSAPVSRERTVRCRDLSDS